MKSCVFCDPTTQAGRLIRIEKDFFSIISKPWFREGHCVVIPRRHVTTIAELAADESAQIISELGRLSSLADKGFGTGVMQKHQPTQAENGIKVNHLHFHVFPRVENEIGLFPVPTPNDFSGFNPPLERQIGELLRILK